MTRSDLLRSLLLAAALAFPSLATAQSPPTDIVSNGTPLDPPTDLGGGSFQYTIGEAQGTRPGGGVNLLQSLETFVLGEPDVALFTADTLLTTENIIAQVTGGAVSQIWGQIKSDVPGANLYFLNPAGVFFGETATLDVQGSFHASTADTLNMKAMDGAVLPAFGGDVRLGMAHPSSFGFTDAPMGSIVVEGATLETPEGFGLSLVGGPLQIGVRDATVPETRLGVRDGRLALASLGAAGEVTIIEHPDGLELGVDPADADGRIDVGYAQLELEGPGEVSLQAGTIELFEEPRTCSLCFAEIRSSGDAVNGEVGGDIVLRATHLIVDGAQVESVADVDDVADPAGSIRIRADSITLLNGGEIEAPVQARAEGGSIEIAVPDSPNLETQTLSLADESLISTDAQEFFSTTRKAKGGDVVIRGFDEVELAGLSQIRSDATGNEAQSGNVSLTEIGSLLLSERAEISSGAFDHANTNLPMGESPGSVTIQADTIELRSGGSIESISVQSGDGGDVVIDVRDLLVEGAFVAETQPNGSNLSQPSGISSTIGFSDSTGGDILIKNGDGNVEQVQLLNAGRVAAESIASGTGGNVEIRADRILVSGINQELLAVIPDLSLPPDLDPNLGSVLLQLARSDDFASSAIAASSLVPTEFGTPIAGDGGDAGTIRLRADTLEVADGGQVAAFTEGVGHGGSIDIAAQSVLLTGPSKINTDTAFSGPFATGGQGGDITIRAGLVRLTDDAEISSDVEVDATGDGGSVFVEADRIELLQVGDQNPEISTDTEGQGDGGNLYLVVHDQLRIDTVAGDDAGGVFANSKFDDAGMPGMPGDSTGAAGSIFIAARSVSMSGGLIAASTEGTGQGGSVVIASSDDFGPDAPMADQPVSTLAVGLAGGAEIAVRSSGTGDAGDILVSARSRIDLQNSAITTEAERAFGGSIDLRSNDLIHVFRSEVTASTQATLADNPNPGDGGNVSMTAPGIALNEATISASAAAGDGGNIALRASQSLVPSAPVFFDATSQRGTVFDATSDTGIDGTVSLDSPEVNLDSGLVALATEFLDASKLIRPSCDVAGAEAAGGSFTVAARRGIPASPEELLVAFGDEPAVPQPDAPDALPAQQVAMRALDRGDVDALRGLGQQQQAQGEYAASLTTLRGSLALAEQAGDAKATASALGSLGDAYLALGESDAAQESFDRGVKIAVDADEPALASELMNSLGNHHVTQANPEQALAAYERSAELAARAGQPLAEARALANAARAAQDADLPGRALALAERSQQRLASIPDDVRKVAVLIHLAKTHERGAAVQGREELAIAQRQLARAAQLANQSGDDRGLGYALINLGELYRGEGLTDEALYLTREGLRAAERAQAPELIYRGHWQAGRILWAKGEAAPAIANFRRAVAVLEESRQETLARYGSAEANFRRSVAPVYLDLVDALLQTAGSGENERGQDLLREARGTVELLKAAELRDYFQNECVAELESRSESLDVVSERAAVVYPVLLPDRIEVLASVGGRVQRHRVDVPESRYAPVIRSLRDALGSPRSTGYAEPASQLYDWLIRPLDAALREAGIETLVFVPGGALRTIPMAVLFDGEHYLVERYGLAVTPSLNVIDPHPLDRSDVRLLAAGISQSVRGAPALPAVPKEIETVKAAFGGRSFLDEEFRVDAIAEAVASERPTIVHIASHGLFTGDPDTSFLLAYDDELTMDRLSEVIGVARFRERPLELLVMSACQTAAGDDRAALGLAGVAIRAGARSAVGSLWNISDDAAYQLVAELYQQLKDPQVSRAEALQRAQLSLLHDPRFAHPYFWSPFLLINNWL